MKIQSKFTLRSIVSHRHSQMIAAFFAFRCFYTDVLMYEYWKCPVIARKWIVTFWKGNVGTIFFINFKNWLIFNLTNISNSSLIRRTLVCSTGPFKGQKCLIFQERWVFFKVMFCCHNIPLIFFTFKDLSCSRFGIVDYYLLHTDIHEPFYVLLEIISILYLI
jgi:hypothetical protein